MKNLALLLMGGFGSRFKSNLPKQFHKFYQKPLFLYAINNFYQCKEIDEILIVIDLRYRHFVEKWLVKSHIKTNIIFISNGSTRYESLYHGIKFINTFYKNETVKVISHDVARPFIPISLIKKHLNTPIDSFGMINTLIPLSDSILRLKDGDYDLLKRDNLYLIQTPQTFINNTIFDLIQTNYDDYQKYTDICSFGIKCGLKIKNIMGSTINFKVTYPQDIKLFKRIKIQVKNLKRRNF